MFNESTEPEPYANRLMSQPPSDKLLTIGWREWVRLPDLGIRQVKAKIDTGARSSTLHAYEISVIKIDGVSMAKFKVQPLQQNEQLTIEATAPLLEYRQVRSSTGHTTNRPVIRTRVRVLGRRFEIDLTLVDRREMGFRMLLGREAIRGRFLVDPDKSFVGGRGRKRKRKSQEKG